MKPFTIDVDLTINATELHCRTICFRENQQEARDYAVNSLLSSCSYQESKGYSIGWSELKIEELEVES